MQLPMPAQCPTMYFIGVTTGQSSIMQVFPRWANEALGLPDAVIKGIDIPIHADPQVYRDVVRFIREDPLSAGALVTTHKIDLYAACRDLFDEFDEYARMFGELSSIAKDDGRLVGRARDPITSGLALASFLPVNFFAERGGDLFIMGAGGSAIAIASVLLATRQGGNVPARTVVSNRSERRLREIERIIGGINPSARVSYHLAPEPRDNDALLNGLRPDSLVINATGLGKDRPGSPLTDAARFPIDSFIWELNYRGDLGFLHQARRQADERNLTIEDGWTYFVYGWTEVIADVFHIDMTPERFAQCDRIAREMRR